MPRSYITDSELKAMADVAHEEKVIEHDEADLHSTPSSTFGDHGDPRGDDASPRHGHG